MDTSYPIEIFIKELYEIEQAQTTIIKKSIDAITICRKLLSEFKKDVLKQPFLSVENEIIFFKNTKQIPLSALIYYLKIYAFESKFSKTSKILQEKFIDKVKNKIHVFFMEHLDFVNYLEQEQTHLDTIFFTRKHSNHIKIIHTQDYFFDLDFNTSHDLLLAKINAHKRFSNYLENRLNQHLKTESDQTKLQWTESKVALTELIYALYHSRVINNGNLEIKVLAEALQKLFSIDLGNFYKIYSDIRLRKKSRTKFLDDLSIGLIHEIEKNDS